MTGYKTWSGILLTFFGVIGLYEKLGISESEAGQIVDSLAQLVGLLLASYGNYDAHKRLNETK